jgi:hypothetical protein
LFIRHIHGGGVRMRIDGVVFRFFMLFWFHNAFFKPWPKMLKEL